MSHHAQRRPTASLDVPRFVAVNQARSDQPLTFARVIDERLARAPVAGLRREHAPPGSSRGTRGARLSAHPCCGLARPRARHSPLAPRPPCSRACRSRRSPHGRVADLQEPFREGLAYGAHTGRRARCDHVAWLQCERLGQMRDLLEAVEDHLAGVSILALSSLTNVLMPRSWGSPSSSAVTIHGPSGPCVSNDLPIVIVGVRICQSRTETSFVIV